MYMGILPLFSGVMVPWTTPPIISGFLIGGWRVALWQFVMIVVSFVIYLPFIKKIDTLELNKENQKYKKYKYLILISKSREKSRLFL